MSSADDMRKILNLFESAQKKVNDELLESIATDVSNSGNAQQILEYIDSKLIGRSKRL